MSNAALRGTHRRFRIRNPYRLATGNRWLQKARQALQRDMNIAEADRLKKSPEILGDISKAATDDKPTVIVEQPANPIIQPVDDRACLQTGSDDPLIALDQIAAQLQATLEVLESAQQVRKLSEEEALSLKVCHTTVRKVCTVAQAVNVLIASPVDDEWQE